MQKIITIALFEGKLKSNISKTLTALSVFEDRVEVIYHLFGGKNDNSLPTSFASLSIDDYSKFVKVAASMARGTYFLCADCQLEIDTNKLENFLQMLTKCKTSVITLPTPLYCNLAVLKSAEVKKIAYNEGLHESSTYLLCNVMLNTKNIAKENSSPFKIIGGTEFGYHIENFTRFKNSVDKFCERFSEERSKLSSSAYKIIFDMLCAMVAERYICSLFLQIKKRADSAELSAFDGKVKALTPFIYFGAEKQFKVGDLKKLRDNNFTKIPFFTALKINSIVKDK